MLLDIGLVLLGFVLSGVVFYFAMQSRRQVEAVDAQAAADEAQRIVEEARTRSELLIKEAELKGKDLMVGARADAERELRERRRELAALESKLQTREETFEKRQEAFERREVELNRHDQTVRNREKAIGDKEAEHQALIDEARSRLEAVAGLTREEAKRTLIEEMVGQARQESARHIRIVEEEAREEADRRAKRIISIAIERLAGEFVAERTVSVIALPTDVMKGRIIGREGRNIRAFEAATGVTVLIDDTPGAVLLSGFDPVRREIGRESMVRLIQDGRIHPTRIEEIVAKVKQEMDETIIRLGEEAVLKAGLPPVHPEVVKLLGRLHFRHSYSQNILDHSVEVAHLMGLMAAELGLDIASAKRAGLLHDIGKAVSHEVEGPHAVIGSELLKRYDESDAVVNGVASHHNDVPPIGPLGILVGAADAISASRPGARSENMTTYLKRVEDLEKIAAAFPGVEKAYAVQAGRELRVFVQPERIGDEEAFALARNIASKIENELQYPGQIKITVIRETRCVEVAK